MKSTLVVLLILICFLQCSKSDNKPPASTPVLSSSQLTKDEGNGGTTAFEFVFKLSAASASQVSVKVTTSDGFAKAGEDYVALDQQLIFAPGETEKKLTVQVVADDIKEGKDDFKLMLTNASGCTPGSSSYTGIITNDDTKIPVGDAGFSTPNDYAGMTKVWADEFDGTAVNTADWNFETGDGCPNCGWGNNELEYYSNGNNVYLQSGKLIIEAREESLGGKNYTSTRMTTKGKKFFKYGRIDIRAKLPVGQGVWPALWMFPEENKFGGWPSSGEIDMMEMLGHEPSKLYSTVHYGVLPNNRNISRSTNSASPLNNEFHVYSMIWENNKMQFLLDNVVYNTVVLADLTGYTYPFNESFFFIFNVAVGGNWPGSPNASTYFPQWMAVDYVRVFQ